MKKRTAIFSGTIILLSLAGCASSERMSRMSGGVFEEYSLPKSQRLRAEKFQRKTETFSDAKRAGSTALGLHDNLINIWPFFFRSNDYISILWPLIDFDPYGLAIRPFYNQEGDDHSILFPLCAWNTAEKSGWLLTGWWNQHSCGFFPLFYRSLNPTSGVTWITPLFYRSWEKPEAGNRNLLKESNFCQALLGYYGKEIRVDDSQWAWLLYGQSGDAFHRELTYRFAKEGRKHPADKEAMETLRDEVFKTLPEKEETKFGFFPLFYTTVAKDAWSFNIIAPLFVWLERDGEARKAIFLSGLLAGYETKPLGPPVQHFKMPPPLQSAPKSIADASAVKDPKGESQFISIPLLSRFSKTTHYCDTPRLRALRAMNALSFKSPFERYRPEMEAELRKIDPAFKLPATVTDCNTMGLYLKDLTRGWEFPTRHEYGGGVLPLFWYSVEENASWWAVPALLTWSRSGKCESAFFSLPLLTYVKRSPEKDVSTILPPIIWYSKSERVEWTKKRIYPRASLWADEKDMVELENDYAALGLYYHGRDAFLVARDGVDADAVELARRLYWDLFRERDRMDKEEVPLAKREERNLAWKPKSRIEELRKLIEEEEIRLVRTKLHERAKKWAKSEAELKDACKKLDFAYNPDVFASEESLRQEVVRLQKSVAEFRRVEDYGSSIFYRKRIFHNNAYEWRFFGGLLGSGDVSAEKEDTHFLHFLYRFRREGTRSEKLLFPFISVQKDGEDSRVSFLWRVFEHREQGGKTSGHILFIPYGEQ